jgi:sulfite reductase (ferredoxin)
LFFEAEEKLAWSAEAFENKQYGDSIYYSYASFIHAAKGLLLDSQVHVNTHHTLINDFDTHFTETGLFHLKSSFKDLILQINKNEPSKEFAETYFTEAKEFIEQVKLYREEKLQVTN